MVRRSKRPAAKRCAALAACALLALLALAPSASAAEAPPTLNTFCPTGSAGGRCVIPRGVAADPASGDIFVANQNNNRIEKFTAWGQFLRAWGWGVVQSGPHDNGSGFEVCVAGEDVCKAGTSGEGPGQFGDLGPQGLALDSAGDLYVIDWTNRRVQKFGPDGEFLLAFGGEVNKTKTGEGAPEAERNLCPVDPDDECGAGVEGTGQGQFGRWRLGSYIGVDTKGTPEASDDTIYVGDQGRVQEFDSGGHYLGDLPDPEGVLAVGGTVNSLAVDPASGDLYLGFWVEATVEESKPNVFKLDEAGENACPGGGVLEAHEPRAVAVGPDGSVYVLAGSIAVTPPIPREVLRFNSSCGGREALFGPTEAEAQLTANPTGIALNAGCRAEGEEGSDLILANPDEGNSFVKIFGPPPNATIEGCSPPAAPPLIAGQLATSVGREAATVQAKVNPRFWPDTTYRVQYATDACLGEAEDWGAGCVSEQPAAGITLTGQTTSEALATKEIFLGGLAPETPYRYRFVAESTGGGPVYGLGGGEETSPGVYELEGSAGSFRTYPLAPPAKEDCANAPYRSGPSANLPDCRAYEMVSPPAKGGGDISIPGTQVLEQAAGDGEAVTFASIDAFAEPEGAALLDQYLAQRGASGWTTRSITSPRSSIGLVFGENLNTRFKAFSEDLCSGWTLQDTDTPLVAGEVPRGVANLYRTRALREGCPGPGGYQLLTTVFPPGYEPALEKTEGQYYPQIQGSSADGSASAFRAAAALSPNACKVATSAGPEGRGIFQTYLSREGTPGVPPVLLSVLPSGAAACTHSSLGTAQSFTGGFNTAEDSLHNALSADGERAYWTATVGSEPPSAPQGGADPGRLYVRVHPSAPRSALAHGSARGAGTLIGPAQGEGKVVNFGANKEKVTELKLASGSKQFAVGQEVSDSAGKLPAGTKVLHSEKEKEEGGVTYYVLTLDHAATGSSNPDTIEGLASEVISGLSTSFGAFAEGQGIAGPGVPFGATILSCAPGCGAGASSLTLSAPATASGEGVSLEGFSACTEPEAACTYPVSEEAEALSEVTSPSSRFLDASSDGSTAIFLTGSDLYEFDLSKALGGQAPDTLIAHRVLGILGASSDASIVYLLSEEALGGEGEEGEPNLYRHARGGGFEFIATLGGAHDATVTGNATGASSVEIAPVKHLSRVAPDGRSAAFVSSDPALAQAVAGYDNADAASGEPDREVYLYDATAHKLRCVSCNPSGASPSGRIAKPNSDAESWIYAAAQIPGWATAMHPGGALSADGHRLFFESFESLVPRDTDGVADVYEWEAASSRSQCLEGIGGELYEAGSEGCLSLISSGRSSSDSQLLDASADGRDVFILTRAALLPQDPDGLRDVYDARVEGGFPPPPAPAAPCEGEACQSPPAAPSFQTPASASFRGAGNVREGAKKKKCKKPKVRRGGAKGASQSDSSATGAKTKHLSGHGKCVKRKAHKKHRKHRRHGRHAKRGRGGR